MRLDRLSIYRKMGDIAQQIDSIEKRLKEDRPSCLTIGRSQLEVLELSNLEEILCFQWNRLHLLETMLQEPLSNIIQYYNNLYIGLCSDCKVLWNRHIESDICNKDWNNYCEMILIKENIIWR